MIISLFNYLGAGILKLITMFCNLVDFTLPDNIVAGITYFLSYTRPFQGIFPVQTLFTAIVTILYAWIAIKGIQIALWAISFFPFMQDKQLPTLTNNTTYNIGDNNRLQTNRFYLKGRNKRK